MNPIAGGRAWGAMRRLCALAAAILPVAAWAAGACVAPEGGIGGIGGTGAPVEHGEVGGTGAPVAHGGIGGTGAPETGDNGGIGGIGGTGQQASGTGIVGIITGFGSVCVDDLEVQFTAATPVSRNGLPTRPDRLALGQVVAIEASSGSHGLTATRIAIVNAVEGPVTRLESDLATIHVMGQAVRLTADTQLAGFDAFDDSIVGLPVRVSGYRNAEGQIVASRIEVARGLDEVSLIGPLGRNDRGVATVGGQQVRSTTTLPADGTETLVRGTWDGSRFVVRSLATDPSLPFAGRVDRVVVEGLVVREPDTRKVGISGFDVGYTTGTALAGGRWSEAQEGRRVRIVGRLGPGRRLEAERVQLLPLTRWGVPMLHNETMGHPMQGGAYGQAPMGFPGGMGGGMGGGGFGGGGGMGGGMGGGGMGGGGMGGMGGRR